MACRHHLGIHADAGEAAGFIVIYAGMFVAGNVSVAVTAGELPFAFLVFVAIINRRAAARLEHEIRDLRRYVE